MKNLDSFYENIDTVLLKEDNSLKNEVKQYVKASKNYQKSIKENVIRNEEVIEQEKKTKNRLFDIQCERVQESPASQLQNIPIGDKESKQWLASRKVDPHLDLDFLPRSLVYNYEDIAESSKMIEKMLKELNPPPNQFELSPEMVSFDKEIEAREIEEFKAQVKKDKQLAK